MLLASLERHTLPRPQSELWGESIRDIGILLLVFAPLDAFIQYGRTLTCAASAVLIGVVIAGISFIWLGVWLESKE
jgi:hypothetical protein